MYNKHMQEPTIVPPQWQFKPEEVEEEVQQSVAPNVGGVRWTASEFMAHQKNGGWYAILFGGAVVAAIIVYLLTKDKITTTMLLITAVLVAVVAARKPRTLTYELNDIGLQIDQKLYPYHDFKAFSVINEGAINSVMLLPLKRFAPSVTVYYDPKDEAAILDTLSDVLPYEERKQDPIDRFMQRIRF